MSLGAIDFGLIVDGSVVMIENIVRHIAARRAVSAAAGRMSDRELQGVILEAGHEVPAPDRLRRGHHHHRVSADPHAAGSGGEDVPADGPDRDLRPGWLAGSLVHPDAGVGKPLLAPGRQGGETWLIRQAKRLYRPALRARPCGIRGSSGALRRDAVRRQRRRGADHGVGVHPRLDEGSIAIQAWRLPSVSLEESIRNTTMIEKVLKRFPEVTTVVSRTGRPEIATDPMGVETSDIYVMLKPHDEWRTAQTKEGLIEAFDEALEESVPGTSSAISQPIELRVQELIAGVRSDVAIIIFGEDLRVLLKRLGDEVVRGRLRGPRGCRHEGRADGRAALSPRSSSIARRSRDTASTRPRCSIRSPPSVARSSARSSKGSAASSCRCASPRKTARTSTASGRSASPIRGAASFP